MLRGPSVLFPLANRAFFLLCVLHSAWPLSNSMPCHPLAMTAGSCGALGRTANLTVESSEPVDITHEFGQRHSRLECS